MKPRDEVRIYSRLVLVGDCWTWPGANNKGYGQVSLDGRMQQVHRVVFEHLRGPIPDGLHLDHLCRVPPCCNPDHLDPVTHAVNVQRGQHHKQGFAFRQFCDRGHELTPENVARWGDRKQACCLPCRREKVRANRARRRALGLPYN